MLRKTPKNQQKPLTDLIRLPQTVNPPHLALLVGIAHHALNPLLPRDAQHKVLPKLLRNVLPQLAQQP